MVSHAQLHGLTPCSCAQYLLSVLCFYGGEREGKEGGGKVRRKTRGGKGVESCEIIKKLRRKHGVGVHRPLEGRGEAIEHKSNIFTCEISKYYVLKEKY